MLLFHSLFITTLRPPSFEYRVWAEPSESLGEGGYYSTHRATEWQAPLKYLISNLILPNFSRNIKSTKKKVPPFGGVHSWLWRVVSQILFNPHSYKLNVVNDHLSRPSTLERSSQTRSGRRPNDAQFGGCSREDCLPFRTRLQGTLP